MMMMFLSPITESGFCRPANSPGRIGMANEPVCFLAIRMKIMITSKNIRTTFKLLEVMAMKLFKRNKN